MTEPLDPQREMIGAYTGPARVIFHGDPAVCAAAVRRGRVVLGGLRWRMSQDGLTEGQQFARHGDTFIHVMQKAGMSTIQVYAGGRKGPIQEAIPHGFVLFPRADDFPFGIYAPELGVTALYRFPVSEFFYMDGERRRADPALFDALMLSYKDQSLANAVAKPQQFHSYGNQAFFDTADVYSWWFSPYGDGPIKLVDGGILPGEKIEIHSPPEPFDYRPYISGGFFAYMRDGSPTPLCVFKNGAVLFNFGGDEAPRTQTICGFFTKRFDFGEDGQQRRCITVFLNSDPGNSQSAYDFRISVLYTTLGGVVLPTNYAVGSKAYPSSKTPRQGNISVCGRGG